LVIENPLGDRWPAVKQRLLREAGAAAYVSGAMNRPFKPIATSLVARHEGGDPRGENRSFFMVDFDYFELLDVAFLAGRSFSEAVGADRQVQPTQTNPHPGAALILNRAMVEKLGWAPEEALGKSFELNWSEDYSQSIMGKVVGVVDNMRVDSLRREVVPLLYLVPSSVAGLQYALVKIPTSDIPNTLRSIDSIWREAYPEQPINRYFLDMAFQSLYAAEEKQISLLALFATLAIVISCLGLFGLAAFTADRRGKEVGIRKTLGGSTWAIVLLLTRDFSSLVLVANIIAWPVAYFAMSHWLENFAYRIDLTPLLFIGSGAIALCIAWVTVAGTVAKAASQRPVLALRYE
jgi:putative ABC transport system permease protein